MLSQVAINEFEHILHNQNALVIQSHLLAISIHRLCKITLGMIAGALPVIVQDQPPTPAKESDYVFKPMEIKSAPGGRNYQGWFSLDTQKFSPKWFRKAIKKHVTVSKRGDGF